jgi:hydrogenase expression/formation protein HypC
MCLGEVGQVVEVTVGDVAEVRTGGRVRTVSLLAADAPVATGDWVLIHSGFALARLTADEARAAEQIRMTATSEGLL